MLTSEERRGFWREPDGTPTSRSIAFQQWALAAHDVLVETAATYHGLISDADLIEAVQARTNIRTSQRNWLGTVLTPVVHLCYRQGEPPLTSLVVGQRDRLVGEGYDEVLLVADLSPITDPDKRERHAAEAQLDCYRWAGSAPADGGEPRVPPLQVAPTRKAAARSTGRATSRVATGRATATKAAKAAKAVKPVKPKRVAKSDQPVTVCPSCFIALPATGVCDNCA